MATAKVTIKGEDQLKGPLKQAENELKTFGQVAQQVGKMIDTASVILAIVAAVKELTQAVGACINEYKNQIEVDTRLNAVLKATNQQYKYSVRDIKDYAQALQQQTRFADDAIESAAQLLVATQKFDKEGLERTLDLSADLAEAMGTDITSAAQTLSKALQEPGEGLTRLKSIGITFTETEKNMITELRNAGKELEAQQVILDKVEAAYGGVAKSIGSIDTSTIDKIKSTWSDIKENLGTAFQNALGPVFDWIYKTLRWLERLTSQVAERSNFNKYISTGNTQALADNFTEDYLNKELDKRLEAKTSAYKELSENYYLNKYLEDFEMTLEEFLRLSTDQRTNLILKLSNNDTMLANMVNQQAVAFDTANDELQVIVDALKTQHEDILKSEAFAAQVAADAAADAVITATNDILAKYGNLSEEYQAKILEDKITEIETYLATNTEIDEFVKTVLEQALENLISQRKIAEEELEIIRGEGVDLGLNFSLPGFDPLGMNTSNPFSPLKHDTMSILGGDLSGLNLGKKDINDALDKYGSRSEAYQIKLLEDEIARISKIMDTYVEENSPLGVWFSEILDNLNDELAELKNIDKGQKTFLEKLSTKLGTAVGKLFGATDEQGQAAGSAIISSFTSSMGEAGEVVSRLATNMATMGPLLGAIVTALHYVIEGLMENLKDIFNDFIQWGIEPLREFGRMIGEILNPILQEIMPSVVASGKVLMQLFQAIARVLTPIVQILMRVLGPVLSVLADVIVSIVGTISWACDWLAYAITWVLNKISFGWIQQSANPGSLSSYLEGMYANPAETYTGSGSTSSTGLTSAAYSGGTVIHLNVYQQGVVCGDSGIQEFAVMIKNELADVAYYGR